MGLLVIARHGNTFEKGETPLYVGSKTNLPLTVEGLKQAEVLARDLQRQNLIPRSFYSGNLSRQLQTAQVVASIVNQSPDGDSSNQVQICDQLNEFDLGSWEGLQKGEIEARWPESLSQWETQGVWPTEVFPEQKDDRIEGLIHWLKLISLVPNDLQPVFAVTSNGVLRMLYSLLSPAWLAQSSQGLAGLSKVGTGCYCLLAHEDKAISSRWEILRWNVRPKEVPEN